MHPILVEKRAENHWNQSVVIIACSSVILVSNLTTYIYLYLIMKLTN